MNRIIGLVTVYYPNKQEIEELQNIAKQVDLLLICNNTPDEKIDVTFEKCQVLNFGENLGLSAAFNRAIAEASIKWKKDDYLIFFDQDSKIADEYIRTLLDEYEGIKKKCSNLALLGPVYRDVKNDTINLPNDRKTIEGTKGYTVQSIITSSMITQYGILEKENFWNEDIFLDLADFDLCWRLNRDGYSVAVSTNVVLEHSVGEKVISLFGKQLQIWNPIRNYYRVRDGLKLYHTDYMPANEKRRFKITMTLEQIINLVFVGKRIERSHYYFRAIRDYRRNIKGCYEKHR